MREIDRRTTELYSIPSIILMEAAASAAAEEIRSRFSGGLDGKSILVLCGPGNNGGDGAALARKLCLAGAQLDVLLLGDFEKTKGDARTNFQILLDLTGKAAPAVSLRLFECSTVEEWEKFLYSESRQPYDVMVDALFGTGVTRPLEGIYSEAVKFLQRAYERRRQHEGPDGLIVSLDIPSGLNADEANPIGETVHADLTVTFTAPKPANVLPPASTFSGELLVADIGSPLKLLEESQSNLFLVEETDAVRWLVRTRYTPASYKNTHGHALIIGGSRAMTGAPALAANAAMSAGAGLVTIAAPSSAQTAVAAHTIAEVMTASVDETEKGAASFEAYEQVKRLAHRANVLAIGPGLTAEDDATRRLVRAVVKERSTPVVIDADALNSLSPWPEELRGSASTPLILTPHQGEMLRLLGTNDKEALKDRVSAAREFATKHALILVLKGTRTLVAAPDGRVFINPTGNAGLGTAGAGDTLTGVITGFLAQEYGTMKGEADALVAVLAALYTSGKAGDMAAQELGMRAMLASDIRRHLSVAIRALDPEGERP